MKEYTSSADADKKRQLSPVRKTQRAEPCRSSIATIATFAAILVSALLALAPCSAQAATCYWDSNGLSGDTFYFGTDKRSVPGCSAHMDGRHRNPVCRRTQDVRGDDVQVLVGGASANQDYMSGKISLHDVLK